MKKTIMTPVVLDGRKTTPTPLSLIYDSFTRSDGALGSTETTGPDSEVISAIPWTGSTFTIFGNKAVVTPGKGAELFNNPGLETWTDANTPSSWIKGTGGTSTINQEGTEKHGGDYSCRFDIDSTNGDAYIYQQTTLVAGDWVQFRAWMKSDSGTPTIYMNRNNTFPTGNTTKTLSTTWAEYVCVKRATTGTTATATLERASAAGKKIYIDDTSFKKLTLASLFSSIQPSFVGNAVYRVSATVVKDCPAGLALFLNSQSNPTAGIVVYHNGTNLVVDAFTSATVWSNKLNQGVSYVVGANIEVIVTTATGHVYLTIKYNNVQIGSIIDITDAEIINNAFCGLFNTYEGNGLDNFIVDGRIIYNLYGIGDSKTVGNGDELSLGGWLAQSRLGYKYRELPTRNATAGYKVADMQAVIDARLAAAVGTPNYVFINLGTNDFTSLNEATWKTNYLYIIDAIHTKWPSVPILLDYPWASGNDTPANTIAGWIDYLISQRPTFVYAGMDERVVLKNGDNGVSLTADGNHPNAAGYMAETNARKSRLTTVFGI